MPHKMLQGGQRDARAYHVRSKGVPKPMWIGLRNLTADTMAAKKRAKPGRSHGLAPVSAFQADEQRRRVGQRPFQPQIVLQYIDDFMGQRQDTRFVPLAGDAHLRIGQLKIFELKRENLTRTQAVKLHQAHQRQIAKRVKAVPERGDLFGGERHNHTSRLL